MSEEMQTLSDGQGVQKGLVIAGLSIPILLIVACVLVMVCLAVATFVILILTLMGPAIGNIFENIVTTI